MDVAPLREVGWLEWVRLPDLGLRRLEAKVDTGARTSSLHATEHEIFERDGAKWVRFRVTPSHRPAASSLICEAPLLDVRIVRSSNGLEESRPTIRTRVSLGGKLFRIDLTLAERSAMGYRMLVGREAVRGRFIVNAAKKHIGGNVPRPPNHQFE